MDDREHFKSEMEKLLLRVDKHELLEAKLVKNIREQPAGRLSSREAG